MDAHKFDISAPDDQRTPLSSDWMRHAGADPAGLARDPGRKPPPNVSRAAFDYIHEMMSGVSTRRKLSPLTAEKYVQMLYGVISGNAGSRSKPVMIMH
ncbi:hypothetical protein AOQ72_03905 [Bradyrhizobium yuanmingense]|uniref:Uncharacterized protein n=1 Tax=Bradyrhizobium yuanmingense TaxID=108015 RepID=A0A0R3BN76_9BRAD|nr:hypothetical protein [Bradyrhizobium yuanmingense]KRP85804.1 hypothetical protein AOQ72_03905 [Bradyrhizobium yuanmingense]